MYKPSTFNVLPISDKNSALTVLTFNLYLTNTYVPLSVSYKLILKGDYFNLRFILSTSDTKYIIINNICKNILANRIPCQHTTLRGGHIMSINNIQIQDTSHFTFVKSYLQKNKDNKHVTISIYSIKKLINMQILLYHKLHLIK